MSHERRQAGGGPISLSPLDLATLLRPTSSGATLEDQMMWRCARVTHSPSVLDEITRLGERLDEEGWERLAAQARANGVVNLLFRGVTAAELLPRMPAPLVQQLRQDYGAVAISTRRLEIAFASALPLLQEQGAQVIVVKGLALARRLYGDIALRPHL